MGHRLAFSLGATTFTGQPPPDTLPAVGMALNKVLDKAWGITVSPFKYVCSSLDPCRYNFEYKTVVQPVDGFFIHG